MSEVIVQTEARPGAARLRLGVLGGAQLDPQHLQSVVAAGAADVVAVAGPAIPGPRDGAWPGPGAARLATLDELLAQPLDGVVVATAAADQAEAAVRVLDHGLPVFCQRPLGRTAAETRRVIDRARANDRLLAVDLAFRCTEAMRVLRPVIQAGELGDTFVVDVVFHATRKPALVARHDSASGGCVHALGAPMLDLALWTLGFPRITGVSSRLYARGELLRPGGGEVAEDYAVALLELDTGVTIRLACSWNLPSGRDAVVEASFYGTEGGGTFRNVNGSLGEFTAELFQGTSRHALAAAPDDWQGRAALDWVQRVGSGERYDPWIEGQIDVAAAVDAVLHR